jgi:hypothetical protein
MAVIDLPPAPQNSFQSVESSAEILARSPALLYLNAMGIAL